MFIRLKINATGTASGDNYFIHLKNKKKKTKKTANKNKRFSPSFCENILQSFHGINPYTLLMLPLLNFCVLYLGNNIITY